MRALSLLFPLLVLLAATLPAQLQVGSGAPGSHATIQSAILAAAHGSLISVHPGSYAEDIDFMGKTLSLVSVGGADQTAIVGSGQGRVVDLSNTGPGTMLDGFAISGGEGGIIVNGASSPVIRNCRITGNHARNLEGGGGILIVAENSSVAMPIIQDCEIAQNTSDNAGGGVQVEVRDNFSACTLVFNRNRVHDNLAIGVNGGSGGCAIGGGACATDGGGGMHLFSRTAVASTGMIALTMSDCEFRDNVTVQSGGGLALEGTTSAVISNCLFEDNAAALGRGGALYAKDSDLVLQGCYLVGNSAGNSGGGLHLSATTPMLATIASSTIADDQAMLGGGICGDGALLTIDLANSIIHGNGVIDLHSVNATINAIHCDIGLSVPVSGTGNLSVDPRFVDRRGGDYHLARNSPLVDAGDPFAIGVTANDRDGGPRIEGGLIDVGADEVPTTPLPGSLEDLELHAWKGSGSDPHRSSLVLATGDLLILRLASAGGGFIGAPALIVGQAFTTGAPPQSPAGLPGIHLDGNGLQVVYGDGSGAFLVGPSIPLGGVVLYYLVPPGLGGLSFRMQGFAVTPLAANGAYAVTEAHDLVF